MLEELNVECRNGGAIRTAHLCSFHLGCDKIVQVRQEETYLWSLGFQACYVHWRSYELWGDPPPTEDYYLSGHPLFLIK